MKRNWVRKLAPCCVTLCGRCIRKVVSGDKETLSSRFSETCLDFEKPTGASEGQTREGRSHRLCVQNSVQQLWDDLHRWDWEEVWVKTERTQDRSEVEAATSKPFTRSQRLSSLSEQNKSALTDYASHDNHVINWSESTILDRESNRGLRKQCTSETRDGILWTGMRAAIYWALSNKYDRFFCHVTSLP